MDYEWPEDPSVGEYRCRRQQEEDPADLAELAKFANFINADADNSLFEGISEHNEVPRDHAPALQTSAEGFSHYHPQHHAQHQQQDSKQPSLVYVLPSHSLPESPPDSGSEPPYSPQDHGGLSPHQQRLAAARTHLQDILMQQPLFSVPGVPGVPQQLQLPVDFSPGAVLGVGAGLQDLPTPGQLPQQLSSQLPPGPTHTLHLQGAGGETILVQHPVVLTGMPPTMTSPIPMQGDGQSSVVYSGLPVDGVLSPGLGVSGLPSSPILASKKRKLSQDGRIHVKTEPGLAEMSPDSCSNLTGCPDDEFGDCNGDLYMENSSQCIRFSPFQPTDWHTLYSEKFIELPPPKYKVIADKGFNFSAADDAFVCQKKNHFQITCEMRLLGDAEFVKTAEGFKKITSYQLHFYGVKTEATAQTIKVEESQTDRSKKPFHPVQVDLAPGKFVKKTVVRLHFSETTSNNMRKKGKPNPDQRYFYLVVGLHAHCGDDLDYPVIAHNSEKIIVRASNPGQFESDAELCWQKGTVSDSIYHTGRCGINTDRPEEALDVHGNLRITGNLLQPSDIRAKEVIRECDTREQLRNVQQIRVVNYRYTDDFARYAGLPSTLSTGVIAQEVQYIIPEAVSTAGDVVLDNGTKLNNLLVVNRDRLFMENVGAVKELCKVTDNLETRIDELEKMSRLTNLKRLERLDSCKSVSSSVAIRHSRTTKTGSFTSFTEGMLCSNKLIQSSIVILVLIIAFCLVAMATLYCLELQKRNDANSYDSPIYYKQSVTQEPSVSSGPSKQRHKAGATKQTTPHSPKLTKPDIRKAGRGGGRVETASAPLTSRPPPPSSHSAPPPTSPPTPPPMGRPPRCGPGGHSCQAYCCASTPPAPVVGTDTVTTPPTPRPDFLTQPPGFVNGNALSPSRPRRNTKDVSNNLPVDQSQPSHTPLFTVLGTNLNVTLGPEHQRPGAPNEYVVYLSPYLADSKLQVQFASRKLEKCNSTGEGECPLRVKGVDEVQEQDQKLASLNHVPTTEDNIHDLFVNIDVYMTNKLVFSDDCSQAAKKDGFSEYTIRFERYCK